MSRGRRRGGAFVLAAALGVVAPHALAVLADEAPAAASDADFAADLRAVESGQWEEAVRLLRRALARHPEDADLHNALGFAYRNLKQLEPAFEHYKRAIALDPRHRGAHEYLGEAYLMTGDVSGAERQLAALRSICVLPCEELADLEKALAKYRAAQSPPAARR